MRHVAKFGVSTVEFRCLKILYENEPLTVNQLAQLMSLTSSRITRIIDGLVQKKIVNRESGKEDRRIYYLSLTSKGKKLSATMINDYDQMHSAILQNIPEEHHQSLLDILNYLNTAVEKWLESN